MLANPVCYDPPVPRRSTPGSENLVARWVATVGGLGDVVPAPGTTAGSAPAAAVWWILAAALGASWLLTAASVALTVAAVVVGVWASEVEARRRGRSDPGPVVIDEVAGQWLCFAVASPVSTVTGTRALTLFVATGFVLFRIFDVVKPWPVRRLERLRGGLGIVADDLAAGALAGLVLAIAWHFLQLQVES